MGWNGLNIVKIAKMTSGMPFVGRMVKTLHNTNSFLMFMAPRIHKRWHSTPKSHISIQKAHFHQKMLFGAGSAYFCENMTFWWKCAFCGFTVPETSIFAWVFVVFQVIAPQSAFCRSKGVLHVKSAFGVANVNFGPKSHFVIKIHFSVKMAVS